MGGRKIIILTGSELRHQYFRKIVPYYVPVLASFCEMTEGRLDVRFTEDHVHRTNHLLDRAKSEVEFFKEWTPEWEEKNVRFIPYGAINSPEIVKEIEGLNPDLIVCYGCSIIKEPLLSKFSGRILNVHLGLSPYYRGSGTNYWALVNNEPEAVGATFMYMDAGIDTGEIIHQRRAEILKGDTPHMIGNRLIKDMVMDYVAIIKHFDSLERLKQPAKPLVEKVYKKKDFTEESVKKLCRNFEEGLVDDYLPLKWARDRAYPILQNSAVGRPDPV